MTSILQKIIHNDLWIKFGLSHVSSYVIPIASISHVILFERLVNVSVDVFVSRPSCRFSLDETVG